MSLPLSRRIAQAALLVAAGATPLVAAGAASADQLMPHNTDLASGISKLDGVTSASTLKGEAHQAGQALGITGAVLTGTALPAMADAAGHTAATALPQAGRVVDPLGDRSGSTTAATGTLTGATDRVADLLPTSTPLGGGLPASTTRSMPAAPGLPGLPGGLPNAMPGTPTVSGVDKVVNGDTLSDPVGATRQLAGQVPATGSLAKALPASDRLTGALPAADRLPEAVPASGDTLGSVPLVGQLAQSAPATHPRVGAGAGGDHLTQSLPGHGDFAHALTGTDLLHLQQLAGHSGESTHRLGGGLPDLGSGLPDLSTATSLLGGATGATQHLPSVS
ncbi:hypothetical protein GCM10009665_41430 [Kitasatospora nipponensis]|uniref:GLTT repeat-containing protein n=1 Tax=Kitasatospora nipponensis TaxID=258049 RepID=A0ABN1WCZ5_9ACTN